jgi:hypothetical protein
VIVGAKKKTLAELAVENLAAAKARGDFIDLGEDVGAFFGITDFTFCL